jgi:hypothetical protein
LTRGAGPATIARVSTITRAVLLLAVSVPAVRSAAEEEAALPGRVQRIVLHVLGGPSYHASERRFVFYEPERTQQLWKSSFGTHWIVWTDGTLWPRHPRPGEAPSWRPDVLRPADGATRSRLAREARPVYSHLYRGNSTSVGIEVAHSGRRDEPVPREQARATAWLVRALLDMSGGRLDERAVFGHKDLDRRPAYVRSRCERPGCPTFVDPAGQPYRRRVDPPESLFESLAREGVVVPRPRDADAELIRAEGMGALARPAVGR